MSSSSSSSIELSGGESLSEQECVSTSDRISNWPWRDTQASRRTSSTDYCGNIVVSEIPAQVQSILADFYNCYPDNCLVPLHAYLLPGFRAGRVYLQPRHVKSLTELSKAEEERLKGVVAELDRGICIQKIRPSCSTRLGTRLARQMENVWCHGSRVTSPGNFEFHIAGGYAVDKILRYGPYTDIDVWFEPRMKETPLEWLVVTAKSYYPTSIIMVNDVLRAIETFDLHICQCAVKCVVYRGKRHYSVHLTRNCALAFVYGKVNVTSLHPAVSQPWKLAARLDKYAGRKLEVPQDFLRVPKQDPSMNCDQAGGLTLCNDGMGLADFADYAARWVVSTNGLWINCNFQLYNRKYQSCDSTTPSVSSSPVIVYPCHQSKSWPEIVYKRGELHRLIRSLAGSRSVLGLRGGGRYDCTLVKPLWLVQRRRMSVADVIKDVKRELPVKTGASVRGISQHVIYCDVPVSVLLLTVDWKVSPNMRNSYVPSSIMLMDPPGRAMDTCKFCISTLQFCEQCEHDSLRRIDVY